MLYKDILVLVLNNYLKSRMLEDNAFYQTALMDLHDLENGSYSYSRLDKIQEEYQQKIEEDLKMLNNDIIGGKNDDIIKKDDIIEFFPNALLLKGNEPKKEIIVEPKVQQLPIKEENVWTFIENISKVESKKDISKPSRTCTSCGAYDSLIDDNQSSVVVCSECGTVNDAILDQGPEWRHYGEDSRGGGVDRCGVPSNFFFPKLSQGTIMAGAGSSRLKRKQNWNSMVHKERSLNEVFETITQACVTNKIPKIIIDSAKILYKKLSDCKHKTGENSGKSIIIRGINRKAIIAACVFKACEMNKNPRSVKEIAQFFGLTEKNVTKGNKHFEKIMKNADDNIIILTQQPIETSTDYIRRHCPQLRINKEDTDLAVQIANNCCKMKLASDHNPQSIAAGAVLVMAEYCDLDVSKKVIAKLFATSEVTITKISTKIGKFVEALVDDELTDHLIKKFKING